MFISSTVVAGVEMLVHTDTYVSTYDFFMFTFLSYFNFYLQLRIYYLQL